MIKATTEVWTTYTKAHPGASQLRYKPIRNYDKLSILLGKDRAIGSLAAEEQLFEEIAKIGGMSDVSHMKAYQALTGDVSVAQAFLACPIDRPNWEIPSVFKWEMINRVVHATARRGNLEILKELLSTSLLKEDATPNPLDQLDENHGSPQVVNSTSSLREHADSPQNNVLVSDPPISESQANMDVIFPSSTLVDSLPNMEGPDSLQDNVSVPNPPIFKTPYYLKDYATIATKGPYPHFPSKPKTLKEALKYPCWIAAMEEELVALNTNDTWDLVPRPLGINIIGSKWIYRAHLVARGFTQIFGLDYDETFSPVVRPTTIQLVTFNWKIRQLDVMQPPVFIHPTKKYLKKSLYGLKQEPRAWFDRLSKYLLHLGFHCSTSDASLFTYHTNNITTITLIYVDDILLTGNNDEFLQHLITKLSHEFAIKDLGSLHYFLGIETFFMLENAPFATPMVVKDISSNSEPVDVTIFRNIVWVLQYLIFTRPDIAFAVNKVSQFLNSPTFSDLKVVKQILRYLNGTHHFGLRYIAQSPTNLYVFSDADWVSCTTIRRSITGFCTLLGANCISCVLHMSVNPLFHSRSKHIELDYHFLREKVAVGHLMARRIPSSSQLADIFTKPLPNATFQVFRDKMGVHPQPHTSLRGC
ncbi:hypothetical protein AAG906_037017 [Vitis piasezkii]